LSRVSAEDSTISDRHVTIGLPTHNGERFLATALEALLAQDHADLEIVVADNASTDATPAIVRAFMKQDARIRLERSDSLVTAPSNFNRVFAATRGPYFMWAADDDRWDPTYVRRCLAALEAEPAAMMACTGLRFIGPDGVVINADYGIYDNPDLSSKSVLDRVRVLLGHNGWYEVYGLARRDALERTHLFQEAYGPDVLLVLELALLGPVLKIPEPLFFYRRIPGRTERDRAERQGGIIDLDAVLATPITNLLESMSATIGMTALPWPWKLRLRGEILLAAYLRNTPIGRTARRELADRIRAARGHGEIAAYTKFRSLQVIVQILSIGPAGRTFIGSVRHRVGRFRRDAVRSWRDRG
jgi:glycosyltransferase involved in cell wall biosynthesis